MDILLNGSKWVGFEPTNQGLSDLIEVSKQPESDVQSAWQQALFQVRMKSVSDECRKRIYAVASQEAQMNMATAASLISAKTASQRSEAEAGVLIGLQDAIDWVQSMRAAVGAISADPDADIESDENWPVAPASAVAVASQF
jgi:hypothetical protein